ncbi:MAG: bifunctional diaminohydroxyphosphoribosylaminopyrimidine deaminase/5-amino-6-(5-phosphoribosylamino)uracil reductase RibD [Oscillospiraceae bacterium]|nr:bifunctional diaminohydroxyphosphoribosylaminopyrimidine deaminase/5-amino-6-(5-phosphoribosylamino)uracil reductase RibD [Oscillospiraceae bacterium]
MSRAIELAQRGHGHVSPNPLVGAVIVKDGQVIGEGYHEAYGNPHAEANALSNCTQDPAGSEMYVTLEPCSHFGKNPPCTQAIIDVGIKSVYIGCGDPNPIVAGKGIQILREHGISVTTGIMQEECEQLNEVFFHYIKNNTPFVALKFAMTLDGKTATTANQSKWITNEQARKHVHGLRNIYSSIMVGVDTVIADDSLLTCRIPKARNPIRIICDTTLRIPKESAIIKSAKKIRTIIATCSSDKQKKEDFELLGCQVLNVSSVNNHVNISDLFKKLRKMDIDSILVEGGPTLNYSVIESRHVNKVYAYIGAKLLGGSGAQTAIGGLGISRIHSAVKLADPKFTKFGDDILIEYAVR